MNSLTKGGTSLDDISSDTKIKAITASDVVRWRSNGVTNFLDLIKFAVFTSLSPKIAQVHITMCMYVFSLILLLTSLVSLLVGYFFGDSDISLFTFNDISTKVLLPSSLETPLQQYLYWYISVTKT